MKKITCLLFLLLFVLNTTSAQIKEMTLAEALASDHRRISRLRIDAAQEGYLMKDIGNLVFLEYLELINLKEFPKEILELRRLKRLSIYKSSFGTLPDLPYFYLANLQSLRMEECGLTSIPDTLVALFSLTELHLNKNQLKEIPNCVYRMPRLEELELDENQITTIHDEVIKLKTLKRLSINENKIENLSDNVFLMPELEILLLNGNNIGILKIKQGLDAKIAFIDLSYNKLASLPDEISSLKNLTTLHISDNPLSDIPTILLKNPALELIVISNTKIGLEKMKELMKINGNVFFINEF